MFYIKRENHRHPLNIIGTPVLRHVPTKWMGLCPLEYANHEFLIGQFGHEPPVEFSATLAREQGAAPIVGAPAHQSPAELPNSYVYFVADAK